MTVQRRTRAVFGWLLLALLIGYTIMVHHGVGPYPDSARLSLWSPRGWLLNRALLAPLEERPLAGVGVATALAAVLAVGVFAGTRSAWARFLAVSSVLATALFTFYGLRWPGPRVWSFFGERGSAVMASLALAVGAFATAPLLARSWLRLGWPARLALYLPFFVAGVALLRNVTGTDPSLRFAISPWPVVPIFGLRLAGSVLAALIAGVAIGLIALHRMRSRPILAAPGVALGVAVPAVFLSMRYDLVLGDWRELALAGAAATGIALAATLGGGPRAERLGQRERQWAAAALLAALPLLVGQALAGRDWETTRNQRAGAVIEALGQYYEREQMYPDELGELVAAGDLEAVPRPRIGFGFLADPRFTYQNFGNSYILEFSAPDWVQCAYNPPWDEDMYDEDEEYEAEASGDDEEALPEAWSCPSKPPELW